MIRFLVNLISYLSVHDSLNPGILDFDKEFVGFSQKLISPFRLRENTHLQPEEKKKERKKEREKERKKEEKERKNERRERKKRKKE